ncbi:hypothetical protein JCM10213v2_000583 [Rhodosporidiobolus nylandii]
MAPSFPSPVASTSRIPYTSSSSPFSTARPFTSSAPRSARRGGAHLIHPMVRQRLTNLTFALAGLLSVATVSLTMSGSLVEAPCPARRTAGAAMQQEREERLARQASARADGGWWKSKGRFLEDPLPIAPTAPAPAVTWSAARGVQAASRAEEQPKEVEQERIARPAAEAKNWRNWGGATATLTLPALPPQSTSLDFSSDSDAPTYRTRASHFTARSLLKPEYVPAVPLPSSPSTDDRDGEGDEKGGVDTAAVRDVSPLDSLRRGNTMMQLIGAGALSLGSTLVISLYVTGPPRLNDMATASTAVLFMTLLLGFAALLILCGEKPQPLEPPPHGKVLRLATLIAFFVAALYSVATLVLFVLLQAKDSFVSFCMQNIPSATDEACKARWDRDWVIILVVGIVWIYHIALGFPVYRYTPEPNTRSLSMGELPRNSGDLHKSDDTLSLRRST